ncbi:hypothetical protein [Kribbella sancticallisti]|uniref:hypothetical protein n=1 Tax=Kribbella sancticallisti TaxID=460087 RepID=UPI0031E0EBB7
MEKPQTSRERYEEAARRELEAGTIAYNVPRQARVKEEFQVTARVQRGTVTISPSLTPLPGTAPVTVEKLRVGTYMRAELRGGGFEVEPIDDTLQLIDGVTEWTWQVVPLSAGSHSLRLTLVVEMDELPLSKGTFERTIEVAVEERPSVVKQFLALFDWSNVVTAVLIAVLVGAPQFVRKRWGTGPGEVKEGGTEEESAAGVRPSATASGAKQAVGVKPQSRKPQRRAAQKKPPRSNL